jgi:phage/plasmid-associated DNA primase
MEFCNHTILGTRGLTESDGTFLYKWTTNNQQHLAGIYDVSIVAVSETEDLFGKKLSVAHTMFLELYS